MFGPESNLKCLTEVFGRPRPGNCKCQSFKVCQWAQAHNDPPLRNMPKSLSPPRFRLREAPQGLIS